MSWSIEEHIGEGRPWPEQVVVYRGETDESLTYARRSLSDVNKMVELMDTLAAENDKLRERLEYANNEWEKESTEYLSTQDQNAKLRKYVAWLEKWALDHASFGLSAEVQFELDMARRDLGVEVDR